MIYTNKSKNDNSDSDGILPVDLALLAYAKSIIPTYWCERCWCIWTPRCAHPKATFKKLQWGIRKHPNEYKAKLCHDCVNLPPEPPRPFNCWYCGKSNYFYFIDCECGHNEYEGKTT